MAHFSQIRVLDRFRPYLHLLTAFNRDHFRITNWRNMLYSVLYTLGALAIFLAMLCYLVLLTWYLLENGANLKKSIVGVPIVLSVLQLELIFIALVIKNRRVTKTIEQLQQAVDQRKSCIP